MRSKTTRRLNKSFSECLLFFHPTFSNKVFGWMVRAMLTKASMLVLHTLYTRCTERKPLAVLISATTRFRQASPGIHEIFLSLSLLPFSLSEEKSKILQRRRDENCNSDCFIEPSPPGSSAPWWSSASPISSVITHVKIYLKINLQINPEEDYEISSAGYNVFFQTQDKQYWTMHELIAILSSSYLAACRHRSQEGGRVPLEEVLWGAGAGKLFLPCGTGRERELRQWAALWCFSVAVQLLQHSVGCVFMYRKKKKVKTEWWKSQCLKTLKRKAFCFWLLIVLTRLHIPDS